MEIKRMNSKVSLCTKFGAHAVAASRSRLSAHLLQSWSGRLALYDVLPWLRIAVHWQCLSVLDLSGPPVDWTFQ